MQAVLENAVVFGRFQGLIGIVSEGLEETRSGSDTGRLDLPGIIVLNTGIIHRVGPGRLTVILARRLAAAGYYVLRCDLSGIGDSKRRGDDLPPVEAEMADLRDAVDWFQVARGIQRVILMGICSGADLSLRYAGTDSRIVGMAIIDASTPPTPWHYVRKCFNYKVLRRKLQAVLSVKRAQRARADEPISADVWQYDDTPAMSDPLVKQNLADAYRQAFANSVRTLAIFTTGAAWYNYRNQLFDAFPDVNFAGNLQFEYLKRCDHTITHEINRSLFFEVVESWLARTEFKQPLIADDRIDPVNESSAAGSGDFISVEF